MLDTNELHRQLHKLSYSLKHEVSVYNSNGSYYRSSVIGYNTSRDHGLLVYNPDSTNQNKIVLLSSVDENILFNGCEYNLNIYGERRNLKERLAYLKEVSFNPLPRAVYCMGPVLFEKEILLQPRHNALMIRYTLKESGGPVKFWLKPRIACRDAFKLQKATPDCKIEIGKVPNGITVRRNFLVPDLYLQFSEPVTFHESGKWEYDVEYPYDLLHRESECTEDLFVPGIFSFMLEENQSLIMSASIYQLNPSGIWPLFNKGFRSRKRNHAVHVN
jgi:predicted glycogen debranching enzyme